MMRVAMLRLMLEEENPSQMAHGLAKLSGAMGKSMERQDAWEKDANHRRSVEKYLKALEPSMSWVEAPAAIETRGRVRPMEAENEAGSEGNVETTEVAAAESKFKPVDWPRPGYPDYYMDVEELKDTDESGEAAKSRIARGR